VEVQGTAEGATFSADELAQMTAAALAGTAELTRIQEKALAEAAAR
jgi:ribonuclease PH